ncbi:response regulator [Patescibacteria group bacterium]|nr:response regulator [Patescibacteria group bacterium]
MKTILFIEDEGTLQKTLGDVLSKEGYKILAALDGEVGARLAKEKTPDLILLDLVLPKMTGLEVLKQLRGDEETKDIPVIVLTNSEDMQDIQQVMDLGATTYLVKSNYELQEVVQKIKTALGENES